MRRLPRLQLFMAFCLFVAPLSLVFGQVQTTRLPLTEEFLKEAAGTEWFGVYMKGHKVGYARSDFQKVEQDKETIYRQSMQLKVKAKASGIDFELNIEETQDFDGKAPYDFRGGKLVQQQGGAMQTVTLTRSEKGFIASTTAKGQVAKENIAKIDFTLADSMTSNVWVTKNPKVGDKIATLSFSFDKLKTDPIHYKVLSVRESRVKGINITYYELDVEVPSSDLKMLQRIDSKGTLLSGQIAGVMELRKESETDAKNLASDTDLFVMGQVKIDKGIGKPGTCTGMIVELIGPEAGSIESGPWQSITKTDDGKLVCKIGKTFGKKVKATEKELQDCREATTAFPAKNPAILKLAKQAIGDAKTPEEKVKNLVKFVHNYITPSFGGKGLVVLDLVEKKAGDCTAYAALFTTLARAAGIPAREVSGFAYMGDSQKAFGGHAWNEVVLDGYWHPIDASTGAFEPDAARLCIGCDQKGSAAFLKNFGSLSLRLIDVTHSK
jgi:hypothetical protein